MLAAVTTTPDRQVKRSHVKHDLKFHDFLKDPSKRIEWVKQVSRGLHNFVVSDHETVCSNHFVDGKSSFIHPTSTLYLVVSDISKSSNRKRKLPSWRPLLPSTLDKSQKEKVKTVWIQCALSVQCTIHFAGREADAIYYTGSRNKELFKCLFEQCHKKACDTHYWKEIKQTATNFTSPTEKGNITMRSLSLQQEFLLTMMGVRTGILLQDLPFLFQISLGLVSNIFTTLVKFLSKELKWIITWPNGNIIKQNLPAISRMY